MVGADAPGKNFNFKPSRMAKNGFLRIMCNKILINIFFLFLY